MTKIDDLIELGLEQIVLTCLALCPRLHASLPKCTQKENHASLRRQGGRGVLQAFALPSKSLQIHAAETVIKPLVSDDWTYFTDANWRPPL